MEELAVDKNGQHKARDTETECRKSKDGEPILRIQ